MAQTYVGKARKRSLSLKNREDNVTQSGKIVASKEKDKTKNKQIKKSENCTLQKMKSCKVRLTDITSVEDLHLYVSKQNVTKG